MSLPRFMTTISERSGRLSSEDEECPNYETVVSRRDSNDTGRSVQLSSPYDDLHITTPLNVPRRAARPLPRHERYVYTYRLVANSTPIQFFISVEPESGKPVAGKYTFRLSFKANGIERSIAEPTTRTLTIDPRMLDFVVFIFPGKSSMPTGCLWSLRIWLRAKSTDHRLFGDDDLWVAKDPDFNSIGDASFARLKNATNGEQAYNAYVGRALVTFIIRWQSVSNNIYKYSLDYEADGVGDTLFKDFKLKLDSDPRSITFLIFSMPSNSIPAGASHKLRVWLRSLVPLPASDPTTSYVLPFNDSYIYQRIWKCDSFKIGHRLDFESLGAKMIPAFSSVPPETIIMPTAAPSEDLHNRATSIYTEKRQRGYDF